MSGQAFFDKIVKKERSLGRVVGLHIEVKEICEIDVFYKLLYISFSKNMKNRPEPRKKTMLETHYYFTPILDHLEEFDHNDWHLYPIVTLPAAKQLRDEEDLPKTISSLNACYDRLQKVSLDYLTVNLYGRKQGRLFLLLLQDFLKETTILDYTAQIRQQILQEIGVSTLNFLEYRSFAKKHLALILKDFRKNNFQTSPASLILTDKECLRVENYSHALLQQYLEQIEKTA